MNSLMKISHSDDREGAIRGALIMLSDNHGIKKSAGTFRTWCAGIDLSPTEIQEVTEYCIKRRKNTYMPTVGEFLQIANDLRRRAAKEAEIKARIEENQKYYKPDPVGQEKIRENIDKLAEAMQNKKPVRKIEVDPIMILEYMTPGSDRSIFKAKGRYPVDKFSNAVYEYSGEYPLSVHHEKYRFIHVKAGSKESPRMTGHYFRTNTKDHEIFTVGYMK